MDVNLVLRKRDRAIIQLQDVYAVAKLFGSSHQDLNQKVVKIRETTLRGCPNWAVTYFEGYNKSLVDRLYETCLVFGGYVGDQFYSTHRDRDDYYQKNKIEPSAYADDGLVKNRGHYWGTTETIRPFFISERKI